MSSSSASANATSIISTAAASATSSSSPIITNSSNSTSSSSSAITTTSPPHFKDIKFKWKDLQQSHDKRPCVMTQEAHLSSSGTGSASSASSTPDRVDFIQFRNYYCERIKVWIRGEFSKSQLKGNSNLANVASSTAAASEWKLACEKKLMRNCHFENDAQLYHTIDLTQLRRLESEASVSSAATIIPEHIHAIKFEYFQPSPNWRTICLRNVRLLQRVQPSADKAHSSSGGAASKASPSQRLSQQDDQDHSDLIADNLMSTLTKLRQYNHVLNSYKEQPTHYGQVLATKPYEIPQDKDTIVSLTMNG